MIAPFDGPRLKVARARRHVTEIKSAVDAYFARSPIRIIVEPSDDEWGMFNYWRVRFTESVPIDLSPMIGDVLHNLRSALDVMACDLVRRAGQSEKSVYFPFAPSKDELGAEIKRKRFHLAGEQAVSLLRSLQPHRKGHVYLRALHDLNVQDKHQMIIPAVTGARLDLSGLIAGAADEHTLEQLKHWSNRVEQGHPVVMIPRAWGPPMGATIKADYSLLLFLPETGMGYELVAFLNGLCDLIEKINECFSKTKP
jgi:hypothetical protein